jgi:hypothetical protein
MAPADKSKPTQTIDVNVDVKVVRTSHTVTRCHYPNCVDMLKLEANPPKGRRNSLEIPSLVVLTCRIITKYQPSRRGP